MALNVSAIIVTRGDVSLKPILDEIPEEWECIVWDNGARTLHRWTVPGEFNDDEYVSDLSVYGRYAAIEYATGDLIYVQDDDVIVSDPRLLVRYWHESKHVAENDFRALWHEHPDNLREIGAGRHVVCNMPPEFRHEFYEDHALVGFGAVFARGAPSTAFGRLTATHGDAGFPSDWAYGPFLRTCDIAFTGLTARILANVPYERMPYDSDDSRMWKQPDHQADRIHMRELMRKAK